MLVVIYCSNRKIFQAQTKHPSIDPLIPVVKVKLYLLKGKRCIKKAKKVLRRKAPNLCYREGFKSKNNCRGCVLQVCLQLLSNSFLLQAFLARGRVWLWLVSRFQVTVLGDYGYNEKNVFMGIVQIELDELKLKHEVNGFYKLFDIRALSGTSAFALFHWSSA